MDQIKWDHVLQLLYYITIINKTKSNLHEIIYFYYIRIEVKNKKYFDKFEA